MLTSEEWKEWASDYKTREFMALLNTIRVESLEMLSGRTNFEDYCNKDGFKSGIEHIMRLINDMKGGDTSA